MNGRHGTTAFLPPDSKIGGQVGCHRPNVGQFFTREQANYVYKKVETGEIINADAIQQEIEQEEQLNRINNTNGEVNPYQELIVNNAERIEPLMMQMEQWSILGNVLSYVQYDRHHIANHTLNIKMIDKHKNKLETREGNEQIELDFGSTPLKLHEEYLDVYESIQSEIINTTRFNENSDLKNVFELEGAINS